MSGRDNHGENTVLCLMPRQLARQTNAVALVTVLLLLGGTCYFVYDAATDSPWPLIGFLALLAPILPFLVPAGVASWLDAHTTYHLDALAFTRRRPWGRAEEVAYEDVEWVGAGIRYGGRHLQLRYRSTRGGVRRISVPLPLGQSFIELIRFLDRLLCSPAAAAFDSPVRHLVLAWRQATSEADSHCGKNEKYSVAGRNALIEGRIDEAGKAFARAEKAGEVRADIGLLLMSALDSIEQTGL